MFKQLAATVALAVAGSALTLAAPAPASAAVKYTGSSYAFQAEPGCLALNTGRGIDGYLVDGKFYDLPTTSSTIGIRFNAPAGLQADYVAVPLAGFTVADPVNFVSVFPGAGCTVGVVGGYPVPYAAGPTAAPVAAAVAATDVVAAPEAAPVAQPAKPAKDKKAKATKKGKKHGKTAKGKRGGRR